MNNYWELRKYQLVCSALGMKTVFFKCKNGGLLALDLAEKDWYIDRPLLASTELSLRAMGGRIDIYNPWGTPIMFPFSKKSFIVASLYIYFCGHAAGHLESVSQSDIEPASPAFRVQSLNQRTTREVLDNVLRVTRWRLLRNQKGNKNLRKSVVCRGQVGRDLKVYLGIWKLEGYWLCSDVQSRLFVTPWTVVLWAPLSMGFSRQEYWSGFPFPPLEDLPDPGMETASPALAGGFFTTSTTVSSPGTTASEGYWGHWQKPCGWAWRCRLSLELDWEEKLRRENEEARQDGTDGTGSQEAHRDREAVLGEEEGLFFHLSWM